MKELCQGGWSLDPGEMKGQLLPTIGVAYSDLDPTPYLAIILWLARNCWEETNVLDYKSKSRPRFANWTAMFMLIKPLAAIHF
jgi:hypothetical protein